MSTIPPPDIAYGVRLVQNGRETAEKIIPVTIISIYNGPVNGSCHGVVEVAGGFYANLAGHILMIGGKTQKLKGVIYSASLQNIGNSIL
ncbi:MAG: hypothetical protein L7F78_04315 [Syntrophales bacterium LBB04]|nr:hypothetical protein [Syntrophales bacterium LBB04]